MNPKQRAFTLIEILIAVAIVGILTAIAYPSYRTYINKSHEAEARAALMALATVLGQYRLDHNTYEGAVLGAGGIFSDQVPVDINRGQATYRLAIESQTASQFLISARPVPSHPDLTAYTIDEAGNKTPPGW